jgi:uncharacterized protein (DUF433 family)
MWWRHLPHAKANGCYERALALTGNEWGTTVGKPRLLPASVHNAYGPPSELLSRVPHEDHEMNWIHAIKGADQLSSDFEYGARLTEIMLLGIVSLRAGSKLHYDAANMRVTNHDAANEFLTRDPDGEIRLTDHRIGLYHVVTTYNEGYSAEMLAEEFPTLPLALIHKVIAFYLEHREEVDAYVAGSREEIERQASAPRQRPDLSELRRRREARRRLEAS